MCAGPQRPLGPRDSRCTMSRNERASHTTGADWRVFILGSVYAVSDILDLPHQATPLTQASSSARTAGHPPAVATQAKPSVRRRWTKFLPWGGQAAVH
ncbi:hypothetical protein SNOG_06165 [Parastagonospora nodorum SN15]|uniref:Uncharacterized protein n=1 Tax=Phaeosphaeria nodorum (strain SN15 / ATCC MYA-4574 / FGSC 10173) TaxID=321614 RepID=Q0UPZ9_PHANO|nr:hypothetical protein SNOG_06165 [Parastagonospora nodorum SN15]EAT85996.1 hypothetical protein SNOG_06165 [Parastagonospora nodorum SN15]